jgi:dihydroflavonol-4-reductase
VIGEPAAARVRVAITGATGFLGGAIARALAGSGAEVHALHRPGADRSALAGLPITWHEGDIGDRGSLTALLRDADWIIHAAGKLGAVGVPDETYRQVNVDGTRNVLAAALATETSPRVVHLSSPGVLGPTAEPADENSPALPTNGYERSKAEAEHVARDFAARGLPVVLARPGFVYGPGDRHTLGLFTAVARRRFFYVDGGRHRCQPTFIDDAVAGIIACARDGRAGEAYHIAGPRAVTFRELGEAIATGLGVAAPRLTLPRWLAMLGATGLEAVGRVSGRPVPLGRTGVAFFSEDRIVSWQKAHRALGYTPRCDVADGVARTVAWYRQNGWLRQ